jgi:hypothetical protein
LDLQTEHLKLETNFWTAGTELPAIVR